MDFDLEWFIEDARSFTAPEYDAYKVDIHNEKKCDALGNANKCFIHSIDVINKFCKDELITYRKKIMEKKSQTEEYTALAALHKKYLNELKAHPYK